MLTPLTGSEPAASRVGRPIRLAAGPYALESALGGDEVPAIRAWLNNPRIAGPLGRAPDDLGDEGVLAYVRRFDRLLAHLFVIRRLHDAAPVGFCTAHLDAPNRAAWIDLVIGVHDRRMTDPLNPLRQSTRTLGAWIFDELGLDKIRMQIAEGNVRTVEWAKRWMTAEGRLIDDVLLPSGRRETVLRFGVLRSDWEAFKAWDAGKAEGDEFGKPRADFGTSSRSGL